MDDDEDSPGRAGGEPGARSTERPGAKDTGSALERYQKAIRQHREASDRDARAAPPGLVALARLVDLAGDPAGGARALRCEERIRAGEIVAHGRPRDPGLFVRHEPIPLEAWAGLVIEWTAGRAVPAEHLRPNSSAEPVWTDLHIPCDVVLDDPTPGGPTGDAAGDHLLVPLADARSLAWRWRQAAAVPPDYPWEPEEFFLARPDQWRDLVATTAGALAEAVRDGRLPTRVGRKGEPVPASAWRATNRRADLDAGRLNLGSPPRLTSGEAGPRWAVALVWLGDLRRWYDETWPTAAGAPPKPETKRTLPLADLEAEMRRRAEGDEMARVWSREAAALAAWAENQPSLSELPRKAGSIRRNKDLRSVHRGLGGNPAPPVRAASQGGKPPPEEAPAIGAPRADRDGS